MVNYSSRATNSAGFFVTLISYIQLLLLLLDWVSMPLQHSHLVFAGMLLDNAPGRQKGSLLFAQSSANAMR